MNILVTEGESDVLLLEALLQPKADGRSTRFVAAGGWSGADSLARSFLVNSQHDVALVVDADSRDPNLVEERRRFLRRSLSEVGARARREVFVISPEIDGLIFEDRSVLEALVGQKVSDTDFVAGQFEPKRTLGKLLRGRSAVEVYKDVLPNTDLNVLRKLPIVQSLHSFLGNARQKVAA